MLSYRSYLFIETNHCALFAKYFQIIVYIHIEMKCVNDNCVSSVDCYYLCFDLVLIK